MHRGLLAREGSGSCSCGPFGMQVARHWASGPATLIQEGDLAMSPMRGPCWTQSLIWDTLAPMHEVAKQHDVKEQILPVRPR
mmetsp:Transcript_87338/g.242247  ORF Transcript_87338/g.242247 Transcript_87338/m.242247 type:complete len:82 (+) Transcript_87338:1220-1465(+)